MCVTKPPLLSTAFLGDLVTINAYPDTIPTTTRRIAAIPRIIHASLFLVRTLRPCEPSTRRSDTDARTVISTFLGVAGVARVIDTFVALVSAGLTQESGALLEDIPFRHWS